MIINGDMLSVLKDTPNASVDCVLTDAPYQQEAHGRGISSKKKIFSEMAEYTSLSNDWYRAEILDEFVRICKFPNIFLFGSKLDVYSILKYAVEHNYDYHIIPVCKKSPMPFVNNTWLANEFGVHITDRKINYNTEYLLKIPYFIVNGIKETSHPNEKNLSMVERIVANITREGDTVFDPFAGSGTTCVACEKLKRNYIAVEINEKYYKMCIDRVNESKRQLSLL